ncbi:hypothetical protein RSOLAG1IB_10864 [Rhizoctonia solani AG-1 IB]|uniref:Ricin B lectin domain-containing protein n=1 Tax=Thanatephorus cucumeris (strain AG1-IB / isolate 7/3/14) TaxID=1108050 RepID=M5BUJ9_THACB|nr:hypothetical protein BN14_04945 [Rhizoctonia solani AG-1 IB]CEL63567.1 hypothetical protein RSOLAG1IB_10864 [Rhizoctonia solani AG-1 IB]
MSSPLSSLPAGTYTLKNVSTGTVLDSYYGKADEGNPVNGYQPHGGPNQQWKLEWTGTGSEFTLRNVKNQNYLSYGRAQNSERVVTSKTPKSWYILVADKHYSIASKESPLYVVDVTESNPENETPCILYNNNATDNQKWQFHKV